MEWVVVGVGGAARGGFMAAAGTGTARQLAAAGTAVADELAGQAIGVNPSLVKSLAKRVLPRPRSSSQAAPEVLAKSGGMKGTLAGLTTREEIVDGLVGYTQQGNRVAAAIRNKKLGLNVMGDELFEKAYRLYGGDGNLPLAFAVEKQLYLRRSNGTLSELVHEGTHGLDHLNGFSGTLYQWEKRAWFFERQFQKASRAPVDFEEVQDMLDHILFSY